MEIDDPRHIPDQKWIIPKPQKEPSWLKYRYATIVERLPVWSWRHHNDGPLDEATL